MTGFCMVEKQITFTHNVSAPLTSRMTRESTEEATVKAFVWAGLL
jgi:hypothetical protein